MLSRVQSKHIRSLSRQKYRKEKGEFLVQGTKIARECLRAQAPIHQIICTPEWAAELEAEIQAHPEARITLCSREQVEAHSTLVHGNEVILIMPMPEPDSPDPHSPWILVLDRIQDPGNLGTMIRIADWFGLDTLVCSEDSADPYQPKVIQAAMGSHLRVRAHSMDLGVFLASQSRPVFAACLEGESVLKHSPQKEGLLLIGNESRGIDPRWKEKADFPVSIPSYGGGAESLNAAVSAGILLSHLLPSP